MRPSALSLLFPIVVLAACGGDDLPTAPATPAGMSAVASAAAGHRVVNSLADPGDGVCDARQCTLREAIKVPGSTEITFAAGLTGTITLARAGAGGGPLEIDKALTISAPSAGITVRRLSTDPAFRLLRVGTGATVGLTNLTLRGGKTGSPGAGIINFGTLTLTRCTVVGNASSRHGGGIDNHGPLTITGSSVVNNSATDGGGGIDNHRAKVTLTNSTVARNSHGGIYGAGGALVIANSAVSFNAGGGILQTYGTSTLDHVRIVGNTGDGGIGLSLGSITVRNSTVTGNSGRDGGGISNTTGGTFTVVNSTISNNTASGSGGGLWNEADNFERLTTRLTLTNSTVSGNSAGSGGGVANSLLESSFVVVTNSTIASNSARDGGGGVRQEGSSGDFARSITLRNTLVALNASPAGPDVLGPSVTATFSLIGDGAGSELTNSDGNQVGNVSPNGSPIDPRLGPLADNGGPTATRALLAGSPAIDAASAHDCPATDQRGVSRPQGAGCDIGSYERK